jgi:RNA polymerase sigma-70 factor (ECF subfamily)
MPPRDFVAAPLVGSTAMDSDVIAAGGIGPPAGRSAARPCGPPVDFRTVYHELYHPVADYLLRRTGDRHATEDLLGDVFLAVLQALPRFRDRGTPVRHWVFRIANHRANRWLRRRRSESRALAARADAVRAELHAAPAADAGCAAREAARRALATLPARQQEVAALHYLAGLPLDEIAAALRLPLGTVKSRLSRALARVRELLPPEDHR